MKIFLFTIDGKPGFRHTLHEAQAVLEEHLRDVRDISDVWWDDEHPYEARKYMYGSSHSDTAVEDAEVDFETTDQLIWPVTLADGEHERRQNRILPWGGAELCLTVRTDRHKEQLVRVIPEKDWSEDRLRPHIVLNFAVNAGQALADHLTSKERT